MKPTALLLLCLALPLSANGLDELRAALGRLQGQGPIRGSYEVSAWSRAGKAKDLEESTGSAKAWVEEDGAGLQIRWDSGLLRRAENEEKSSKEAKKSESVTMGIDAASALKVFSAVNFAPRLARLLANGQMKQERAETYQGKPARLLEIQLQPPHSGDKEMDPKENTYTAQVWMGSDGMPLGAALTNVVKAKKLFISIELTLNEEMTFSQVSNRLVVLRREERMATKTMGIEAQTRTISTFTPKVGQLITKS